MSVLKDSGYGFLILSASVIVFLDQLTKFIIPKLLTLNQSIEVIPGLLNIVYIKNPGAAFGLFREGSSLKTVILILVSLIALAVIIYLYERTEMRLVRVALTLIAGGALGNLIDRIRLGEVVDFIDLHIGHYHWPAFNMADSAISIGVFTAVLILYFGKSKSMPFH